MKINKISITNYRSIKETQIIDNIGDSLIFTGINNSGKSTILSAILLFLGKESINDNDLHKGTNFINIIIEFVGIEDTFLKHFCDIKINQSNTTTLKSELPVFNSFSKNKIDYKKDFFDLSEEQRSVLEDRWLCEFKIENDITNGSIKIEQKFCSECKQGEIIGKNKALKDMFPKAVFIDDERNFENEEYGGSRSITKSFFETIEFKSEEELDISTINQKVAEELSIEELEMLLQKKGGSITNNMQKKISENFEKFYKSDFKVKIKLSTSIEHKNFSLETMIVDPLIGEVSLSNVGAGLRALYLLSLLKAYNDEHQKNNVIFLIEEPELYLHPGLQKEMANILLNISNDQQVFFTTHSPIMLKKFDLTSLKEVKKDTSNSTVDNAKFNDIINNLGYSLFDIIEYKYLIFVEGRDDSDVLKKIINKYYPTKKNQVEIITSNGCGNLAFYASIKFLGLTNKDESEYLILRDRDNKNDDELKEEFSQKLTEKDLEEGFAIELTRKLKILDRYSIENFFMDETKIKLYYSDFTIDNFIIAFNEREGKIRPADSLKKKNEEQFSELLTELKGGYSDTLKKIRGHNILDALVYYMNGSEGRYLHSKEKKDEYIDHFINNSTLEDFTVLKEYLDELFV